MRGVHCTQPQKVAPWGAYLFLTNSTALSGCLRPAARHKVPNLGSASRGCTSPQACTIPDPRDPLTNLVLPSTKAGRVVEK